jgi:hypothetical protein
LKGAPKPKNEELRQLATYLEEVRAKLVNHYRELEITDQELTADAVKNAYLGIEKKGNEFSLVWLIDEHNTMMGKVLKQGSLKNYYTTARYIKFFLSNHDFSGGCYLRS